MPTFDKADQFKRDYADLSPDDRQAFKVAVKKFIEDLKTLPPRQFRGGLRVKPMQDADGIFEMTWEIENGRATFEYGDELSPGDPHIIWRRVGGHAVFGNP